MSHDLLDELVADAPRLVVPDVNSAWRAGANRRRRRYAAGLATAVVLGVVAGAGVVGFDPLPRLEVTDGGGLTGYPAEIPKPITLTDLPEKPGPMAGVLILEGIAKVAVVDSHGRSWLIPDVSPWEDERPTLSDDGRMLGYLAVVSERRSEFVMLDLITGKRTTFPDVGDGRLVDDEPETEQPYFSSGQAPGYWSPDNRWLAVNGAAHEDTKPGPLLLGVDGQVRELGVGTWPVGWFGPDRIAVLTPKGQLKTVNLDGEVLERVELAIPDGYEIFGQWSAALSANRKHIAVRVDGDDHRVILMDTRTGGAGTSLQFDRDRPCQLTWPGNNLQVVTWDPKVGLFDVSSTAWLITPSSHWGEVGCGTFVADALKGQPQDGPGLTEWRYWSMRHLVGGLLLILFVLGCALLERRVARRRGGPA
jgi:hypothetical protein